MATLISYKRRREVANVKKLSRVVLPSTWTGATSQSSEAINGFFNRVIGHPGYETFQTAETPQQA
jgi:hypothetical protein